MDLTSDPRYEGGSEPALPTLDELNALHEAYERALDEYADASTKIMDQIRRRMLPTGEQFARKRAAQQLLITRRREFWRANRRYSLQKH